MAAFATSQPITATTTGSSHGRRRNQRPMRVRTDDADSRPTCGKPLRERLSAPDAHRQQPPSSENASRGNGSCVSLSRGRRSLAASAGLSVSELKAEDDRRDGDGQRELAEELPGDAADEGAWHEHRAKDQPDGDHRPRDLLHGLDRGVAGRHAVLDVVLDRLDHDNRVVHHDADRQHQPEQRQVVQA